MYFLPLNSVQDEYICKKLQKLSWIKGFEGNWEKVDRLSRITPKSAETFFNVIFEDFSEYDLFGNIVKLVAKAIRGRIARPIYDIQKGPVKYPVRKRGYNDKGFRRPSHITTKYLGNKDEYGMPVYSDKIPFDDSYISEETFFNANDLALDIQDKNIAAGLLAKATSRKRRRKRKKDYSPPKTQSFSSKTNWDKYKDPDSKMNKILSKESKLSIKETKSETVTSGRVIEKNTEVSWVELIASYTDDKIF